MKEDSINVLLAGETWIVHKTHVKGFDTVTLGGYEDFSEYFKDALSGHSEVELTHIPNHLVKSDFPKTPDALLEYDVIVLSDVGSNTLTLYPEMFEVPMGPDRLESIRQYVEKGGGLVMCGGWMSFQGFQQKAAYGGTPIEKALPVNILEMDDRVERTDGVSPKVEDGNSPVLKDMKSEEWPEFLGYNRLEEKEDAELVATIGEKDPFIVVWSYGKGRSMAFASDLAPHWGTDFVEWDQYKKFWLNSLEWLSGRE
ncbi:MAG: glutamine amidotransferase [Candidatus Hadarchaeia archaeon]